MIWLLLLTIFSFTNGEIKIKRNGMIYQQMSSNGSWNAYEYLAQADNDNTVNQFTELVSEPRSHCKCGWSNRKLSTRIVGGDFYTANKYPFIAVVAQRTSGGWKPFCGGSIVTQNHVITAAHCTHDLPGLHNQLAALLGTYDLSKPSPTAEAIGVMSVVQHDQFNSKTLQNDLAILVLSKSITYSAVIGPVCMPQSGLDVTGQTVKILGWGAQKFGGPMTVLPKEMDTTVVSTAPCSSAWPGIVPPVKAAQICTFSQNASPCKGDSGGPVVWLDPSTSQYTLVGIVSFGPQCTESKPSVQTKVVSYLQWIQNTINANKPASTCSK